jgi:hypothetical protein
VRTAGGRRTSSLQFWSDNWNYLIREGSGYWQYVPEEEGVRFLTRYDYRTRFGLPGRLFDRAIFRPLMAWATAWSFDRLRIWVEDGVTPEELFQKSLFYTLAPLRLAPFWIYTGLFFKRSPGYLTAFDPVTRGSLPSARRCSWSSEKP